MGFFESIFGMDKNRSVKDLRSTKEKDFEQRTRRPLDYEDEEIADEVFELLKIYNRLANNSGDPELDRTIDKCAEIGRFLCQNGGRDRMLLIAYRVQERAKKECPIVSLRDCELVWDGICGWHW